MSVTITLENLSKLNLGKEVESRLMSVALLCAAEAVEKPKKVLSPEHLAKLKAGRERKKAFANAVAAGAAPVPEAELVAVAEAVPEAVAAPEAKPKKVLSPEHLAKLKAGRERKKAEKAASAAAAWRAAPEPEPVAAPEPEPVAAPQPEPAPEPVATDGDSSVGTDSSAKKRGPKKLVDMTPEEKAAHDAKKAARQAAKAAMTPEEKAAYDAKKAARAAKKAAKAE